MKENRTKMLILRLTENEKKQAVKRAKDEGLTLSSYIRKCVLNEKFVSRTDVQTVFELKKIGTNLNQLAKHVNTLPVEENILESLQSLDHYIKELKLITTQLI